MIIDYTPRTWDLAVCAGFCRVREENGDLSNMANGMPFVDPVTGIKWPSSEAWYQAQRYPGRPDLQDKIRFADNAFMAKTVAYESIDLTRPDWDEVKVGLMARAIELKATNGRFAAALLATGDKPIVEVRKGERFWGASPSGNGTATGPNVLGQIQVERRELLKAAGVQPADQREGQFTFRNRKD